MFETESASPLEGSCGGDPPCPSLLTDFPGVMRQQHRWPRHICRPVAQESTRRWAEHSIAETNELVSAYKELWPLPVGRDAILHRDEVELDLDDGPMTFFSDQFPMLPFFGYMRAAFAVRIFGDQQNLDLFGLFEGLPMEWAWEDAKACADPCPLHAAVTESSDDDSLDLVFCTECDQRRAAHLRERWEKDPPKLYGPLAYTLSGVVTPSDDLLSLLRSAREWWAKYIEGRPIRAGGRPRLEEDSWSGWRKLTEDAIALRAKHPGYTWEQIARRFEVPPSTLKKWRRRLRTITA